MGRFTVKLVQHLWLTIILIYLFESLLTWAPTSVTPYNLSSRKGGQGGFSTSYHVSRVR
jgi:hypothetical protein